MPPALQPPSVGIAKWPIYNRPGGAIQGIMMDRKLRYSHERVLGLTVSLAAVAAGCGPGKPAACLEIQSTDAASRINAILFAVSEGDLSVLPQLVDRLEDEDPAVRFAAAVALEKLTGERMGYHYGGPAVGRAGAVARWRRYLAEYGAAAVGDQAGPS